MESRLIDFEVQQTTIDRTVIAWLDDHEPSDGALAQEVELLQCQPELRAVATEAVALATVVALADDKARYASIVQTLCSLSNGTLRKFRRSLFEYCLQGLPAEFGAGDVDYAPRVALARDALGGVA